MATETNSSKTVIDTRASTKRASFMERAVTFGQMGPLTKDNLETA